MCGRFTLSTPLAILTGAFPWLSVPDQLPARYNIAPTQPVPVVPNNGANRLEYFQWGLIPFWAKDPKIGNKMINARAETIAEKPAYRSSLASKRCLVLADGFYEWRKTPGQKTKTPYFISFKSGAPFAFAGLWDFWRNGDGSEVPSCTIITTDANELVRELHDRMPVILQSENVMKWIDPVKRRADELTPMLLPYPAGEMRAFPVSTLVNIPANDSPELIRPLDGDLFGAAT